MNPQQKIAQDQGISSCYTAAQLAAGLSISKRGVLYALGAAHPDRVVIVSGNPADAWFICSLPVRLQERLQAEATRHGHRNAEQLLTAGLQRWRAPVPVNEVAQHHRNKALLLQRALAPALARQSDQSLSESEFERLGTEDYKRVLGSPITARHWRRLFKRTLERDAGTEDFGRLEIFLDENAGRQNAQFPAAAAGAANAELQGVIGMYKNPADPSDAEVGYLWTRVFENFESDASNRSKKAKRLLVEFLLSRAPVIAQSRAGLRRQFDRKYAAWVAGGRVPSAVIDRRPEKSGRFRAPALSEQDKDRIVGEAVILHGGRRNYSGRL